MNATRTHALAIVAALSALPGCALFFEFPGSGGDAPANTLQVQNDGPSGTGRANPVGATRDGGVTNSTTNVSGSWSLVAAPELADGVLRTAARGRDVWLVGSQRVMRLDTSLDRLAAAPTNAQALARSVVVLATDDAILGWTPLGGSRYVLQTDRAEAITRDGAPSAWVDPLAVWTGNGMLVWGGASALGSLREGALFIPTAGRWTPMSDERAPSGRTHATTVWTGTQMIVFGGTGPGNVLLGDGGLYGPGVSTWLTLASQGAPSARAEHTAVWTGTGMLVWGGRGATGELSDGAIYDARTATWRAISPSQAPSARRGHVAVWTGTRMIVFGGTRGSSTLDDGAIYDPIADQWTPIAPVGISFARSHASAAWTGRELVVAGGDRDNQPVASIALWRPAGL